MERLRRAMRTWFPFTDYDFYAYLASGMIAIAAVDYGIGDGVLVGREDWTFVAGAFWTAIAYLTGSILATPASIIIEHVLARRFLRAPADLQLGMAQPRRRERAVAAACAPREYAPLRPAVASSAVRRAADQLGLGADQLSAEDVFQAAFHRSRQNADTVGRLASFQNQYGMHRNIAFVAALATALLSIKAWLQGGHMPTLLAIGSAVLSIGSLGRFVKFYAAYSRELLLSYASGASATAPPSVPPPPGPSSPGVAA